MANSNQSTDSVILVMGPTGAGKTTFINLASKSDLRVGHSLQSYTDQIQLSNRFQVQEKNGGRQQWVVLVDSPGFDDTEKSDSDILKILCEYLASEYSQKRLVQGVIYLHRITDNRVSGTSMRNLQTYQEFCGADALENSVIATTMWSRIDPALGGRYELELKSKEKFFKSAMDRGARYFRHVDTEESAHDIIRSILGKDPKPLRIQQELVDENKKVFETAAGEALMRELAKAEQKHYQEFLEVQKELAEAREQQELTSQKELEEEYARLEEVKKMLEAERAKLLNLQLALAETARAELAGESPDMDESSSTPLPPSSSSRPLTPTRPSSPTPIPTANHDTDEEDQKKPTQRPFTKVFQCFKSFWKRMARVLH